MLRTCLLITCFALPLPAQDSPLVIETTAHDIAERLLQRVGSTADLPALDAGEHWRLALGDDDRLAISVGQGLIGFLQVQAHPAALMYRFGDQVKSAKAMARGIAAMSLSQAGIKTADSVKVVRAVFDLPVQMRSVTLRVIGDPEAPEKGIDAQLWIHPVADSWLAEFVVACRPTAKGCPQVLQPDAAMAMLIDADPVAVGKTFGPFNDFLVSFGGGSQAERAARAELVDRFWAALDGTATMSWRLDGGGMVFFAGLSDAEEMARVIGSPSYLEWTRSMQDMDPGLKSEIQPDAIEHRGTKFYKTITRVAEGAKTPPNPMMPGGEMTGYGGVAGSYWIGTAGRAEEQVVTLIDRAVDKKIGRDRLPEMIVARMRLQLTKFIETMSGGAVHPGGPASVSIDLGNNSESLFLNVKVK